MADKQEKGKAASNSTISAEEWRRLIMALLPKIESTKYLRCIYGFTKRLSEE